MLFTPQAILRQLPSRPRARRLLALRDGVVITKPPLLVDIVPVPSSGTPPSPPSSFRPPCFWCCEVAFGRFDPRRARGPGLGPQIALRRPAGGLRPSAHVARSRRRFHYGHPGHTQNRLQKQKKLQRAPSTLFCVSGPSVPAPANASRMRAGQKQLLNSGSEDIVVPIISSPPPLPLSDLPAPQTVVVVCAKAAALFFFLFVLYSGFTKQLAKKARRAHEDEFEKTPP